MKRKKYKLMTFLHVVDVFSLVLLMLLLLLKKKMLLLLSVDEFDSMDLFEDVTK